MSDVIIKAQRASEIVRTSTCPAWQKVDPALEALSGLTLSNLNKSAHQAVEVELVAVNQMTAAHDIVTEADYEKLTDSDALDILARVNAVTQLCIDSETERVMQELDTAGQTLPFAAIEEVRKHPDVFVPQLIRSLEQALLRAHKGKATKEDAPFFAAFLLTELEVSEAYPILLDMFRLPDDGPYSLMDDGLDELVAPVMALSSKGNTDDISKLVQDSNVNMFVRWAAAQAYTYLVRDGLISRQVAIDALHRHLLDCLKNRDHQMVAPLICQLGNLAAETSLETIRSAYERGLVDQSIVDLAFIESQIASGEETVKHELEHCRPTGVPDTIAELSQWATFREAPLHPRQNPNPVPTHIPLPLQISDDDSLSREATSIRTGAKVGRNDPCPCGSGKKFKKCCL